MQSILNRVLLENTSKTFNNSLQALSFSLNLSFKHSFVNILIDVKLLKDINQVVGVIKAKKSIIVTTIALPGIGIAIKQ